MKIHSYEAGTTQEHILYERRLDHESILLRSGRARGGSREERHTESKIRWWGLCANPDPYPFGSITESKIRCWGLCVNECSLHYTHLGSNAEPEKLGLAQNDRVRMEAAFPVREK